MLNNVIVSNKRRHFIFLTPKSFQKYGSQLQSPPNRNTFKESLTEVEQGRERMELVIYI